MFRALLSHEKYFEFSRVWLEDFKHPDGRTTSITNTNKMIRTYQGCDGGKTGFTNEAGFCLAATAKRGETRLVSVVIGAESSQARFGGTAEMLDFCFHCYESRTLLEAGTALEERASVSGSRKKEIAIVAETPLCAFGKRGEKGDYSVSIELGETAAPIARGEEVGSAVLYRDGVEIARTRLLADEDAPRMTWWDAFRETLRSWQ